ncbi:hypothetical protein O9992_19645 [Vibrio lentus]|nr:hypothetical protein [Vibrio lentus]
MIVTGGDNDHVEGGDFDDIIHLGDSGSNAAFGFAGCCQSSLN